MDPGSHSSITITFINAQSISYQGRKEETIDM